MEVKRLVRFNADILAGKELEQVFSFSALQIFTVLLLMFQDYLKFLFSLNSSFPVWFLNRDSSLDHCFRVLSKINAFCSFLCCCLKFFLFVAFSSNEEKEKHKERELGFFSVGGSGAFICFV